MITESPLTGGKVILHKEPDTLSYRGEDFAYTSYEYECVDTGQRFTDLELDWKNMSQIYDQYRQRHNIPSPAELTSMRERYGLSANKMAQVLGLGVNQYAKYEQGEMPSESIGKCFGLSRLRRCSWVIWRMLEISLVRQNTRKSARKCRSRS